MPQQAVRPTTSEVAYYPISTVSRLTGVNAITLRAWESRYGLVQPVRKDSGHRVYTQADIDLIHRIVGMLDRGIRIGDVKSELDRLEVAATSSGSEMQDEWQRHFNRMLAAVIRYDEAMLDESYTEMLSLHPAHVVTERLLTPLIVELGRRWESMDGNIAEEHFFGFYLRSKLGARFHHRVRRTSGPRLLACCLPGDQHEIGLLLFALAANDMGFQVVILGANMPLDELPDVIRKADCDALVLSSTVQPPAELLEQGLPGLVDVIGVPVLVGGAASIRAAEKIAAAGAIACGTDARAGLKTLQRSLQQVALDSSIESIHSGDLP